MLVDRLKGELVEVADEAVGRTRRHDPVTRTTGGPAGNARLTAWTGLVLFVLFVVEVVTTLQVRAMLTWHVVVGILLIPPTLLKTASVCWRILRYYTRNPAYRAAGPPPTGLRVLGPLVILTTLLLLGTGLALIVVGADGSQRQGFTLLGQRIDLLSLHQASFVVAGIALGLHVLARAVPALSLTVGWAPGRRRARNAVPGERSRLTAVVASLVAAGVAAALLLPLIGSWRSDNERFFSHFDHDRFRPPGASAGR